MSQIIWVPTTGGSWKLASNWGGTLPGLADNVQISQPGVLVSIDGGFAAQAFALAVQNGAALSIAGGSSLYTVAAASIAGNMSLNTAISGTTKLGSTWTIGGTGASVSGFTSLQSGSNIVVRSGVLALSGGSLAGTISGSGTAILGGITTLGNGFTASITSVGISGVVNLTGSVSLTHNTVLYQNAVLNLNGNKITIGGNTELGGTINGGTVVESGRVTLGLPNAGFAIGNGASLSITGQAVQFGTVALGFNDSGAALTIGKTGSYAIAGNWVISDPSQIGTLTNQGLLSKTAGSGAAAIGTSFTNSGTVNVGFGELQLYGWNNSLSGTISGSGTLGFGGGHTVLGKALSLNSNAVAVRGGVVMLAGALNGTLGYGGIWDQTGGIFDLGAKAANLTLTGNADLDGGLISGYGGTLVLAGATEAGNVSFGGPISVKITGTLRQTHAINFGASSTPTATIAAAGAWYLDGNAAAGDDNIGGGGGLLINQGLFGMAQGAGLAVEGTFIESTGILLVNSGTLLLANGGLIGGRVNGSGVLELGHGSTFAAGVVLNVAHIHIISGDNGVVSIAGNTTGTLTYAGVMSQSSGTLSLSGKTMALSAGGSLALDGGALAGGGTLSANGYTAISSYAINAGTTLQIGGHAEQNGATTALTDNGTLSITSSGVYTLLDDSNIGGTSGVLNINGGVLQTGGSGVSGIGIGVNNNGGSIIINNQTLQFDGRSSLGGTISGSGMMEMTSLSGSQSFGISAGASISVAAWQLDQQTTLSIGGTLSYGGYFNDLGSNILLQGQTLTLAGSAVLNGALTGAASAAPGRMSLTGTADIGSLTLRGGAQITASGAVTLGGPLVIGGMSSQGQGDSSAGMTITSAGSVTLDTAGSISGAGSLSVAGTLAMAGDFSSAIGLAVVDSGTILANLGTLSMLGVITGSGSLQIGSQGELLFSGGSSIGAATSLSFTGNGGDLVLAAGANFATVISNFTTSDMIELGALSPGSLSGSYGTSKSQLLISDSNNHTVTLNFAAPQTLSQISFITAADGLAALVHS